MPAQSGETLHRRWLFLDDMVQHVNRRRSAFRRFQRLAACCRITLSKSGTFTVTWPGVTTNNKRAVAPRADDGEAMPLGRIVRWRGVGRGKRVRYDTCLAIPAPTFGAEDLKERCRSGRSGRSRKPLCAQAYRGFESHPLRQRLALTSRNSNRILPHSNEGPICGPISHCCAVLVDRSANRCCTYETAATKSCCRSRTQPLAYVDPRSERSVLPSRGVSNGRAVSVQSAWLWPFSLQLLAPLSMVTWASPEGWKPSRSMDERSESALAEMGLPRPQLFRSLRS
jgi:hypothetical protein